MLSSSAHCRSSSIRQNGSLPGEGEDGGGHLVEGAQHLLLGGEALHALAPSRDRLLRCLEWLAGPGFPGDGGHLGRGEQGAKEEEWAPELLVGGDVEDEERLLLLGGELGGGLEHPGLADAGFSLENHRGETGGRGGQELLGDDLQLAGTPDHGTLGPGGAGAEGSSRGGTGLPGHPLPVGRLVSPQHLEQPPSVGEALEPEQTPVDDPDFAQCAGEVLDHLRDQDLTALSLVGDPGGGVDRGSMGITRRLGDVAAVQTHPHRERLVGIGSVVILDGPLDRGGGLNRLVGRGEQRHEPVAQRLGFDRAGDLQSGADQFVVKVDDLVGGGVTHPHPEIGGAFEIREQDREGSLHRFSLRHSPYLPEQDHVNGDGMADGLRGRAIITRR